MELEEAHGTAATDGFDTPEDAVAWQEANAGVVHFIPVYESDGTTQIGNFRVGETPAEGSACGRPATDRLAGMSGGWFVPRVGEIFGDVDGLSGR